ncbi:MAG: hypothetical protein R2827_13840 [Bdellovibrionales bacterium]
MLKALPVYSLLILILLSWTAEARQKSKVYSITTRHTTYQDFTTSSDVEEQEIEPSLDVEIGLRMHSLFQFIMVVGQSVDSTINQMGIGFRVDTPGFFWVGKFKPQQYRRPGRQNWVNSSIFGYISQNTVTDSLNVTDTSNGTNMGITIDVFPWNKYGFITVQASLINISNNFFMAYSAGIGAEF